MTEAVIAYKYTGMMTKYTTSQPNTKHRRQKRLLEIVRADAIKTQSEIVSRLEQEGFSLTQVSVSRDIRELGLVKSGGRYICPDVTSDIPDIDALSKSVSGFLERATSVGDNLVVVQTLPGTAHSVGLLLDQLDWPDLAGTIAGDDTIFVAVHNAEAGIKLTQTLRKLMKESTS